MKTAEQLEAELLAENPDIAYKTAVKMTVAAVAIGDTEWSEVTAACGTQFVIQALS